MPYREIAAPGFRIHFSRGAEDQTPLTLTLFGKGIAARAKPAGNGYPLNPKSCGGPNFVLLSANCISHHICAETFNCQH